MLSYAQFSIFIRMMGKKEDKMKGEDKRTDWSPAFHRTKHIRMTLLCHPGNLREALGQLLSTKAVARPSQNVGLSASYNVTKVEIRLVFY